MTYPAWIALSSLVAVLAAWGVYLASIASHSVPEKPWTNASIQGLAVGAAVLAIALKPAAITIAPGSMAIMMGSLFLFLLTQRHTPVGNIKISVGEPLLAFTAKNADGSTFDSSSLGGRRILLKFFRGSW